MLGLTFMIGFTLIGNWGEFFVKFIKKGETNMCMPQMDRQILKSQGYKIM